MNKNPGRKQRRDIFFKNRREEGRKKAKIHNWRQSHGRDVITGEVIISDKAWFKLHERLAMLAGVGSITS